MMGDGEEARVEVDVDVGFEFELELEMEVEMEDDRAPRRPTAAAGEDVGASVNLHRLLVLRSAMDNMPAVPCRGRGCRGRW